MKKFIISGAIALVIILAIVFQLFSNKQELDKARQPVDRTQIPVAVKVSQVVLKELETAVHYPATIQPFDEVKVYAQASGIIDRLNIDLGTEVYKDQVIGKLDTRILEINLKDAIIVRDKAKDDYDRASDLYKNNAGPKIDMLNARTNYDKAQNQVQLIRQQLDNAQIVAPIHGIVFAHNVKEGEFINPGTPIAAVSNIFKLKATAYVNQETAYLLSLGQVASISAPVLGEKMVVGEVIYISPVADVNHNFQVDLVVQPKENIHLKGGTDVQVFFNTVESKKAKQVPKSAVMTDAEAPYVFVVDGEKVTKKTIKTGASKRDQVEILSGLQEGETVVTTGQINLSDGSKVSIIK